MFVISCALSFHQFTGLQQVLRLRLQQTLQRHPPGRCSWTEPSRPKSLRNAFLRRVEAQTWPSRFVYQIYCLYDYIYCGCAALATAFEAAVFALIGILGIG